MFSIRMSTSFFCPVVYMETTCKYIGLYCEIVFLVYKSIDIPIMYFELCLCFYWGAGVEAVYHAFFWRSESMYVS